MDPIRIPLEEYTADRDAALAEYLPKGWVAHTWVYYPKFVIITNYGLAGAPPDEVTSEFDVEAILAANAPDIVSTIEAEAYDAAQLQALLEGETNGKNRKTVTVVIEVALEPPSESETPPSESETPPSE